MPALCRPIGCIRRDGPKPPRRLPLLPGYCWDRVFRLLRLTRAALGRLCGPSVRTPEPATYTCVRWTAIVDQPSEDAAKSGLSAAGVQRMGQLKWRLSISACRNSTLQLCELVRVW